MFEYEPKDKWIKYTPPVKRYLPDFVLENGVIIEAKGRFTSHDRAKHLLIKKQNPEFDIRFVFQYPNNKLTKNSKTTYGEWCDKHGFLWADKEVPLEWTE